MSYHPQNPLIVQSDRSVLLEVDNPLYADARDGLGRFAELEKSPEHVHTYRITPLSLWNAASAGLKAKDILSTLEQFSKYEIPQNIRVEIEEQVARYGRIKLEKENGSYVLTSQEAPLIAQIWHHRSVKPFLKEKIDAHRILIDPYMRGHVKQALIKIGFPVQDLAGYVEGDFLHLELRSRTLEGKNFVLRRYQQEAIDTFHADGSVLGGSGVIVLPCGAGKTMVGLGIMARLKTQTLILATSTIAVRQWIREILDKTSLSEAEVGEYTGETKGIRPVTISTYQILTYRKRKSSEFVHFGLFNERNWGIIIYDEVHLLPAPVFRITAELQAKRRLGLTATLVREDGREDDVFSLIGPKKYDVPWKILEKQGWIATAVCTEIRINLPAELRMHYALADGRTQFRIASENPQKFEVLQKLLQRHKGDQVLIIGQYIDQITHIAEALKAPLITGQTPNRDREKLYADFRNNKLKLLVISKVGNFAIDLPDANVLIQVSGTFGSRQEEAQRLGRILRPKSDGSLAHFYSLITRDTKDQDFAANRQLFLTEQGYSYEIRDEGNL
ncbi:MAG: helicase-associated domain-containing protein [candidate division KSB1 bacterium]|nr:helicase-associated domain-containing protein [candidate division KSB1 bacterium]